ncbi:hypothetical protein KKH26_01915 [Patescibacteria group bacterium]|nr:hypothetical protein [Patescibacteria group bacterium]
MKKIFIWLFLCLILSSFCIGAEEKALNEIKDSTMITDVLETYKAVFSMDFLKGNWLVKKQLLKEIGVITLDWFKLVGGFEIAKTSVFGYFFIGFIAGLFLWIIFSILSYFKGLIRKALGNKLRENPFEEGAIVWLGLVVGHLWKVVILGVFYAVLMQIPIINRVLQIITLDLWINGFWFKTFVFAVLVGFLPSFIEWVWKERLSNKYEKAILKQEKIQATAE